MALDTSRYRRLLLYLVEQLELTGDTKSARVAAKWFRESDQLLDSIGSRKRLAFNATQVQRTANALVAITRERRPEQTPAANGMLDLTLLDLIAEANLVISECGRIDEVLNNPGLAGLVSERLISVTFVMDYLQFGFDEGSLTVNSLAPFVESGRDFLPSTPGYRDALCSLIGFGVSAVDVQESERIEIRFSTGQVLRLSLRSEDTVGPESVTFSSGTGGFWVW